MTEFALGAGVPHALAELAAIAREFPTDDVPGARMYARARARLGGPVPELHEVRNVTIPRKLGGLGLRVYRPAPGRLPVVLYLHGGWFYYGDLESHDTFCRSLAAAAGCVVIALHYRRAPEHPFPAAPDDCTETAQWIADHADDLEVDPTRFAIAGDSAGGALAVVTTRRARDHDGPAFRAQVLLYPVIGRDQDTESWRSLSDAPLVSAEQARWAWSMYLPDGTAGDDPDAVPGAIADLAGLPPTLVVTAEYDPLRDEGEAFAARLAAAGVETRVHRFAGMVHGFAVLGGLVPAAGAVIDEVAAQLRGAWGAAPAQ
jgi:acetyl esterase